MNKTSLFKNIVRYSIVLIILGCIGANLKTILTPLILIPALLLMLPFLDKIINEKIPFLTNKVIRYGIALLLFVGALNLIPETKEDKLNTVLNEWLEQNKGKNLHLYNIAYLIEQEKLFSYSRNDSVIETVAGVVFSEGHNVFYMDTLGKHYAMYLPFKNNPLNADKYLKPLPQGVLKDYGIMYQIEDNKITGVQPQIIVSNGNTKSDLHIDNIDLRQFEDAGKIALLQKVKANALQEDSIRQVYKAIYDKFEKECISGYDGSCYALVDYLKKNYLKDPESFEHLETHYGFENLHFVVIMKYRAKNSFGGFNIETVKAIITSNCEVAGIIGYNVL